MAPMQAAKGWFCFTPSAHIICPSQTVTQSLSASRALTSPICGFLILIGSRLGSAPSPPMSPHVVNTCKGPVKIEPIPKQIEWLIVEVRIFWGPLRYHPGIAWIRKSGADLPAPKRVLSLSLPHLDGDSTHHATALRNLGVVTILPPPAITTPGTAKSC